MYEGPECELQSNNLKTVNVIKKSTVMVAIVFIIIFYVIIIFMDLTKYLIKKLSKPNVKKIQRKITKVNYIP